MKSEKELADELANVSVRAQYEYALMRKAEPEGLKFWADAHKKLTGEQMAKEFAKAAQKEIATKKEIEVEPGLPFGPTQEEKDNDWPEHGPVESDGLAVGMRVRLKKTKHYQVIIFALTEELAFWRNPGEKPHPTHPPSVPRENFWLVWEIAPRKRKS